MIYDTIGNWREYAWKSERFVQAFAFLETMTADTPDGRYEIDGDNVYCMFSGYETRGLEGHQFEAHRVYADIQYMLSGEESVLWAPTPELTVTKPYEPDIAFFALTPNPAEIVLTPGRFCVLWPQDAHAPCTTHVNQCAVRKAVVKVRLV